MGECRMNLGINSITDISYIERAFLTHYFISKNEGRHFSFGSRDPPGYKIKLGFALTVFSRDRGGSGWSSVHVDDN